MTDLDACPFCARIAAGNVERTWPAWSVVAFTPRNPVTPGHLLVVPMDHVSDVTADPQITTWAMYAARILAREAGSCNVITSVGSAATQTVFHLHIHVVPRREGDGLALPWTGQHDRAHADARPW